MTLQAWVGMDGSVSASLVKQLLATFIVSVLLQAPKLLDLDLMNGVATEEGDSELLLKVDLQHFGEVRNYFVCKT